MKSKIGAKTNIYFYDIMIHDILGTNWILLDNYLPMNKNFLNYLSHY